jgi:hypothetical protein
MVPACSCEKPKGACCELFYRTVNIYRRLRELFAQEQDRFRHSSLAESSPPASIRQLGFFMLKLLGDKGF